MTRPTTAADRAASAILRQQNGLITRPQALAAGLSDQILRRRIAANGRWQIVLPGVYLSHNGGLTAAQREVAAALYAGKDCVLTGMTALRAHGMRVQPAEVVDVLIPATTRRQSIDFVRVRRTTKVPERPWLVGGLRYASAARAVADAVRGRTDMDYVRSVVAGAVQQRRCTVPQLAAELRAGPRRGSAGLRNALAEVADGVRSLAEGDLRKLIKKAGLPEPMYNPQLFVDDEFLACPDVWWPDAGVAGEADSREWHLSPADWERTLARHARMSAHGILVLHFPPRRIRSESAGVVGEMKSALESGRRRGPLAIRTVPAK